MRASTSRRRSSAAVSRSSARPRSSRAPARRLDGSRRGLVQPDLLVLRLQQYVGGLLARLVGLGKFRKQRAAALLYFIGRIGYLQPFGIGLGAPVGERADLRGSVFSPVLPARALAGDRRQTTGARDSVSRCSPSWAARASA